MGTLPTFTWSAPDVPMGMAAWGNLGDGRSSSLRLAIVNQSRNLVVELLYAQPFPMNTGTSAATQAVFSIDLAKVTGVTADDISSAVTGTSHDTGSPLAYVSAYCQPLVSGRTTIRKGFKLGGTRSTRAGASSTHTRSAVSLIGGDLGLTGAANRLGVGPRMAPIRLRPGEGLAVLPSELYYQGGGTTQFFRAGGISVEFVVVDGGGKATSFYVHPCNVGATPGRAYAALWNDPGHSAEVYVLAVVVENHFEDGLTIAQPVPKSVGVTRWTPTMDAAPFIDQTPRVVSHNANSDYLSDNGIRCVSGDIPMPISFNDTLQFAAGAFDGGGIEATSIELPTRWPMPGAIYKHTAKTGYIGIESSNAWLLLYMPGSRGTKAHYTPISVYPGHAVFVSTQAPGQVFGNSYATGWSLVDWDVLFQVRAARGAPFARSA